MHARDSGERPGRSCPGLLIVLLALLAVGVLTFQVGKAAVLRRRPRRRPTPPRWPARTRSAAS